MFSKDPDEVNDLFQDILIKLWKGFASFKGQSSAKTWIYRVALNSCLDSDRRKKREGERVPLSVDINPYEDTDADALQIRQLYSRNKWYDWIKFAIPILIVWLGWLFVEIWLNSSEKKLAVFMIAGLASGALIGGILGHRMNRKVVSDCDEILRQIDV